MRGRSNVRISSGNKTVGGVVCQSGGEIMHRSVGSMEENINQVESSRGNGEIVGDGWIEKVGNNDCAVQRNVHCWGLNCCMGDS